MGYRCMRPVIITMLAGAALSACSGLATNSLPGNVRSSTQIGKIRLYRSRRHSDVCGVAACS